MKKYIILILLIIAFGGISIKAENQYSISDYAIDVKAEFKKESMQIALKWSGSVFGNNFTLRKKEIESNLWDTLIANSGDTLFIDNNVNIGSLYEYSLINNYDDKNAAYAYIIAGEIADNNFQPKNILLLIDEQIINQIKDDIEKYKEHLVLDGYNVSTATAPRAEEFSPPEVKRTKELIDSIYYEKGIDYLILLGRVPVPYSGAEAIDGHQDHFGAWHADAFYGIFSDKWTDTIVDTQSAAEARNHNIYEDGKYDQTQIPAPVMFSVSRIDFYNLPIIQSDEIELYKKYIQKVIDYSEAKKSYPPKALIDDRNGTYFIDKFAAEAYINFKYLFNSLDTGEIIPNALNNKYAMVYAASLGLYDELKYVIKSDDFNIYNLQTPIINFIGSYFCDWDSKNNLLRSALTSDDILNSYFGGRPYWHLHKLKYGFNMGDIYKETINNYLEYSSPGKYGYQGLHISLLGDPTTRLARIEPPKNVRKEFADGQTKISWEYEGDALGFDIFAYNDLHQLNKLNIQPLEEKEFLTNIQADNFAVRAVKIIQMPEGSFIDYSKAVKAEGKLNIISGSDAPIIQFSSESGILEIDLNDNKYDLTIYNYLGEEIFSKSELFGKSIIDINSFKCSLLRVLFVVVQTEDKYIIHKELY